MTMNREIEHTDVVVETEEQIYAWSMFEDPDIKGLILDPSFDGMNYLVQVTYEDGAETFFIPRVDVKRAHLRSRFIENVDGKKDQTANIFSLVAPSEKAPE